MTTAIPPALTLLNLQSKAQDLLPEHTYKAVMHRIQNEQETDAGRCELLGQIVGDFERGMT